MMDDSGSDGSTPANSMGEDFADSLIVDAIDLTNEMGVRSGEDTIRLHTPPVVNELSTHKKKQVYSPTPAPLKPNMHPLNPVNSLLPIQINPNATMHHHQPQVLIQSLPANTIATGMTVPQYMIEPPISNIPTVIDGVSYNNRGYEICGAMNKFNRPCQRIGRNCPFHGAKVEDKEDPKSPQAQPLDHSPPSPTALSPPISSPGTPTSDDISSPKLKVGNLSPSPPIKKGPYKRGWTKDEHVRFLKGLQLHGKGSWKEISQIVQTRSPSQIQVHAHRYFLRQLQDNKNKRSIHDFTLDNLTSEEGNTNPQSHHTNSNANVTTHTTANMSTNMNTPQMIQPMQTHSQPYPQMEMPNAYFITQPTTHATTAIYTPNYPLTFTPQYAPITPQPYGTWYPQTTTFATYATLPNTTTVVQSPQWNTTQYGQQFINNEYRMPLPQLTVDTLPLANHLPQDDTPDIRKEDHFEESDKPLSDIFLRHHDNDSIK